MKVMTATPTDLMRRINPGVQTYYSRDYDFIDRAMLSAERLMRGDSHPERIEDWELKRNAKLTRF